MDMTPAQICAALRERLAQDVAPRLSDDHAQSQLQAAIDVLGKIAPLLDWSQEMLGEQLDALEGRLQAVAEAAAEAAASGDGAAGARAPCLSSRSAASPDPAPEAAPAPPPAGDLDRRLAARRAEALAWLDWLNGPGRSLAPEGRERVERPLREAVQAMLAAERRRIAAIDFSSMTHG